MGNKRDREITSEVDKGVADSGSANAGARQEEQDKKYTKETLKSTWD